MASLFNDIVLKGIRAGQVPARTQAAREWYRQQAKDKNEVFIFNGWTFSSSPAVNPFDHPVYDIWLTRCY